LHISNHSFFIAKDASVLEKELDELEVYGSSEAQGDQTEIQKYVFQVSFHLYTNRFSPNSLYWDYTGAFARRISKP